MQTAPCFLPGNDIKRRCLSLLLSAHPLRSYCTLLCVCARLVHIVTLSLFTWADPGICEKGGCLTFLSSPLPISLTFLLFPPSPLELVPLKLATGSGGAL